MTGVRRLGRFVETVHAIVYFAPEPQAAYADLGLRGYWRGYFASRAAALGAVGPDLVTALFAGFAPQMVERAIPQVWQTAPPARVAAARVGAATAAMRRLVGDDLRAPVETAAGLTAMCVAALPMAGRPMAAANRVRPRPDDAWGALWHDCTVLREFRGDAHVAAVAAAGWRWPEPHLVQGAAVDPRQQEYRGWSDEQWAAAATRAQGRSLAAVEDETDRLTEVAFALLAGAERARLAAALEPVARACAAQLPYPTPSASSRSERRRRGPRRRDPHNPTRSVGICVR